MEAFNGIDLDGDRLLSLDEVCQILNDCCFSVWTADSTMHWL